MSDAISVERLETVWTANTDKILEKLNGLNRAVHGTAADMKRSMDGVDIEKSLGRIFDSSRLAVMEAGASRLRIFGSALEPLGALGLGAAAGIAAAGVAVERAMKAAEWAEQIEAASKKLGLSTTTLQEFDHVAAQSGIPVEAFRQALGGLSEKIGLVQAGLAKAQTTKVFQALDISPEQLRRMGDVTTILPVIADKLAALPATERAGLAERLDITAILPALIQGRDHLADLVAEAHRYGLVADEDLIKKSAEAAEKLKLAGEITSKELTVAFANLSPLVADVAGHFADAARDLADFIKNAGDALEPLAKLADKLRQIPAIGGLSNVVKGAVDWEAHGGVLQYPFGTLARGGRADKLHDAINAMMAGGATTTSDFAEAYGNAPPPVRALLDAANGRGRRGRSGPNPEDVAKSSADAIAKATNDELRARLALTSNVEARLDIETKLLAAETAAQIADLEADVAAKKKTRVAADQAETLIKTAALEKQALLDREAEAERNRQYQATQERIGQTYDAIAKINAEMADTAAERRAIELKLLEDDQRLERKKLAAENAAAIAADPNYKSTADALTASLNDRQGAERRQFDQSHLDPFQAYLSQMRKAAMDTQTAFQNLEVDALQTFNNSLVNSIVNFRSLGDVAHSVLQTIEADLIRILLNKAEASIFGSILGGFKLPGFADGTLSAPGGLSVVGENGPELMNVPRGAQIIPNHAIGSLGAISPGMASPIVVNNFAPDLRGAVVTQDLLDQMNQIGHTAALQGATMGVQAARQMIPQEAARRASLQIR